MRLYKLSVLLFFLILLVGSTAIYATELAGNDHADTQTIASDNINTQIPITNNQKNIKTEPKTIVLNSTNFNNYVTDKQFNENVSNGDTVDIQGKLDSPNFALDISKPVNIISSTNDAFINFHTGSYLDYGGNESGIFRITEEGAGTNITGIYLNNTRLSLEHTKDITINNITCVSNESIGKNVGAVTIREGSENITITNSYFRTEDNGGHSNVVFAVAYNCLFENNTVEGYYNGHSIGIGNLLYLTTYNVNTINLTPHNVNITIRNNIIQSYNIPEGINICWGLVMEGYGHIIENNIINHSHPAVVSQYSDSEYGSDTDIGNVTFRNNIILNGETTLNFKGEVYNNTFLNDYTSVSKSKVYNNSFKNVIISSNTTFENNTATHVLISEDNILLNNNIITTANNDYAIDISSDAGENISITNNKLASYLARGSDSINGTAIVENNNPTNLYVIINDTNYEQYLQKNSNNLGYYLKDKIQDNDWICFDYSEIEIENHITLGTEEMNESGTLYNLTIFNTTTDMISEIYVGGNLTLLNTKLMACIYGFSSFNYNRPFDLTLINSTIGSIYQYFVQFGAFHINENLHKDETSIILNNQDNSALGTYVDNVFYVNRSVNWIRNGINPYDGTLNNNVTESAILLVNKYTPNSESDTVAEITIDKPVNLIGFNNQGFINTNINFVSGSSGSNISNIYINGSITTRSSSINIDNCTVVNGINFNAPWSNVTNSLLYNTIKTANARQCNIINNTIICEGNNTLNIDFMSLNVAVTNNTLIKDNLYGIDSASVQRAIWNGNYPLYPVDIQIDTPDKLTKDVEEKITITVTNNNTQTNVLNGYVEVYLDGIFQDNTTLTNGVATVNVNAIDVKTMPLKVWYYSNDKYQNTSNYKLIDVSKKEVNIEVDEFSSKVNENTTITVRLTEKNTNKTVTNGKIKLQFDMQVETINITDGIATITLKAEEDWIYAENMTIIFDETEDYNNNSITIPLNTTLGDVIITNSEIIKDNNNVNFNLYIQNILGENIIEGTIQIKDNNNNILIDQIDVTGNEIFINITPPEDNMINIEFTGWIFYTNTTQTLNITLPPTETTTTLTVSEIILTNIPTTIIATVTAVDENIINGGTITFTIGNEVIAQAAVTNGTATATVTFTEEADVIIVASYTPVSGGLTTSTAEATTTIQAPVTQLNIEDVTLTVGETVTLTATVTDQLGNNINGGKVTFKVNGKTVKDANGKVVYAKVVDGIATAQYTVPDDLSGKDVNITAVYSGTSKYNKETATITSTVANTNPTITTSDVTATVGGSITLTATITDNNKVINSGKVVFKINGKTVKDTNGKVIYVKVVNNTVSVEYTLPADLKAKDYNITATFISSDYDKLEDTKTLTVTA